MKTLKLKELTEEAVVAALDTVFIRQANEHLPYISAEGGYQFIAGPEYETDDILDAFGFVTEDGDPFERETVEKLILNGGPWFLDKDDMHAQQGGDDFDPDVPYEGPSASEMEEIEHENRINQGNLESWFDVSSEELTDRICAVAIAKRGDNVILSIAEVGEGKTGYMRIHIPYDELVKSLHNVHPLI